MGKQARIGCKGKQKYWSGYTKHVLVDMQSGLINKVAATSANITDARGFRYVCPNDGAVYADKVYGLKSVKTVPKRKNCHDAMIKRNSTTQTIKRVIRAPACILNPKPTAAATTACGGCAMITDRYVQLKALHLHGMAAAWQEWQTESGACRKPVMPEVWLD